MSKKTQPATLRSDMYARVSERIVADLEQGVRPWMRPWSKTPGEGATSRPLRHNGMPYRGINVLVLWGAAADKGFTSPTWLTYRQAHELGGHVRQGETGSLVVYANTFTTTDTNAEGEEVEREAAFLKAYTVFNVEQIDGLPGRATSPSVEAVERFRSLETAEGFFAATGARVRHGGNRAFYAPSVDTVQLPPVEAFRDAESYAATKAHEFVHWTGHERRLARTFGERFGDEAYAVEELVAEMGAAFLCADLGISQEVRADHADYLASWLKVLRADKRAIFTAASQAQCAADYLHERAKGATTDP
jgi:antirestriction protein ArdC